MPKETSYLEDLLFGRVRFRLRFVTNGGVVTSFLVQLEAFYDGQWKPVRRYDDYHGRPHVDVMDRWGRERQKVWLELDRNSALTEAIRDIRTNWNASVADFLGEQLQ